MSILQLVDEIPASAPLNATVAEAIARMLDLGVGAVAIVDENNVVAGIFTERDVLRKVALTDKDPKTMPVREVMTSSVVMATSDISAAEALEVMVREHHRHLPVVDEHGKLLGILSIRHLLQVKIDDLLSQWNTAQKA
jgi:CBS domain-containing protein